VEERHRLCHARALPRQRGGTTTRTTARGC
jgi:hypothetical protein